MRYAPGYIGPYQAGPTPRPKAAVATAPRPALSKLVGSLTANTPRQIAAPRGPLAATNVNPARMKKGGVVQKAKAATKKMAKGGMSKKKC